MDLIQKKDYHAMCKEVADRIAAVIRKKADDKQMAVIGLATGSTPEGVYEELVNMHNDPKNPLSFENVITFNLDEYIVDPKEHPKFFEQEISYHGFMEKHLFSHIAGEGPGKMRRDNIHIPDTSRPDIDKVCAEYEDAIRAVGPIDLQLVGVGENGHLGFCEPGKSDSKGRTSRVQLDEHTIAVNKEKFGFAASEAISMGLGTINDATQIILIANSTKKGPIIADIIENRRPAQNTRETKIWQNPSQLLNYHRNAIAIIDREALQSPWSVIAGSRTSPDGTTVSRRALRDKDGRGPVWGL